MEVHTFEENQWYVCIVSLLFCKRFKWFLCKGCLSLELHTYYERSWRVLMDLERFCRIVEGLGSWRTVKLKLISQKGLWQPDWVSDSAWPRETCASKNIEIQWIFIHLVMIYYKSIKLKDNLLNKCPRILLQDHVDKVWFWEFQHHFYLLCTLPHCKLLYLSMSWVVFFGLQ